MSTRKPAAAQPDAPDAPETSRGPAKASTPRRRAARPQTAAAAVATTTARATKPAKGAKVAKVAKPLLAAKSVKTLKAPKAPKLPKKPAKPREQLVRDGFTMPVADFALIADLKLRAMAAQRAVKKSELLRAGLRALSAMEDGALLALLGRLEPVKIGRPKKDH